MSVYIHAEGVCVCVKIVVPWCDYIQIPLTRPTDLLTCSNCLCPYLFLDHLLALDLHLWLGIESVDVVMSGVNGSVRGVPGRVMDRESAGVASVDRFRAM